MGASTHLKMISDVRVLRIRQDETRPMLKAGPVIPDLANATPITGNTKPFSELGAQNSDWKGVHLETRLRTTVFAWLIPLEAGWPPELFLRVNYLVSGAWTAAFAAMAVADGAVTFDAGLPLYASVAISLIALSSAIAFTLRYPALAATRLNG